MAEGTWNAATNRDRITLDAVGKQATGTYRIRAIQWLDGAAVAGETFVIDDEDGNVPVAEGIADQEFIDKFYVPPDRPVLNPQLTTLDGGGKLILFLENPMNDGVPLT